jgi:hypothetical protein
VIRTRGVGVPKSDGAGELGAEIEHPRPLPRVLGARDLPVRAVQHGVNAIPKEPSLIDCGGVEFLAHHGFDRISPQRHH